MTPEKFMKFYHGANEIIESNFSFFQADRQSLDPSIRIMDGGVRPSEDQISVRNEHITSSDVQLLPNGDTPVKTTSKDEGLHSLHRVYHRNAKLEERGTDDLHSLHRVYSKKSIARSQTSLDIHSLHRMNSFVKDTSPNDTVYSISRDIFSLHQTLRFNPEMAISNFNIKFSGDRTRYQPGEEICGDVVMDVWATVAVRYVEFVLQGKGTLRKFEKTSFSRQPRHELYLDKQSMLMKPTESGYVVLTPGHYISTFSYRLPLDLPSNVKQTDMGKGHVFDVTYSARAHVCDSVRAKHKTTVIRVVKGTKRPFVITPTLDWQSLPGALEPIIHAEQLLLACTPCFNEPTSVMLYIDRGVYPIGDQIKCSLEIYTKNVQRIKEVYAELTQHVIFRTDKIKKHEKVILKALNSKSMSPHEKGKVYQGIFILTVPNIVPSNMPHCRLMDITYNICVTVKFRHFGGVLKTRIPVVIAPASEAERQIEHPTIPIMSKPIRQFPYFSDSPSNSAGSLDFDGKDKERMIRRHEKVQSEYQTCFVCCCCECCLSCLKFGILASEWGQAGPRLNIKTVFPTFGDSHVKDKTVAKPSYF